LKRRAFITLLGSAAAWPLAARAQQGERVRRIGVLMNFTSDDPVSQDRLVAFVQGLQELGWTVGRNLQIDCPSFGRKISEIEMEAPLRIRSDVLGGGEGDQNSGIFKRRPQYATDGASAFLRCSALEFPAGVDASHKSSHKRC